MKDPLLVDSITIGRSENRIEKHIDGSMVLRDVNVPGVRLMDIIGGNVVIDPSVYISINESDWVADDGKYNITVFHNWNLCYPALTQVNVYDENHQLMTVDEIKVNANSVIISVIIPTKMYVSIKKI